MYMRVTRFKVNPAHLDELSGKIKEMSRIAKSLRGVVDIYAAWRGDGQGVVTSVYESKEHADKAVARIQVLWGALAGLIEGAPNTDAFETVEHIVG